MDTGVSFRGAMLNLKDCQCPTGLVRSAACLKYPTLCLLAIPGVRVYLFWVLKRIFLLSLSSCVFSPGLSPLFVGFAFYF